MDTQNKNEKIQLKSKKLENIKASYRKDIEEIVSLGNKCGWTVKDMEDTPELLIHLFYEYLDLIK